MVKIGHTAIIGMVFCLSAITLHVHASAPMSSLPATRFRMPYLTANAPMEHIKAFKMDRYPVSNRDFAAFVQTHPQWARNRANPRQTDAHYLHHWYKNTSGFVPKMTDYTKPVTNISWFAAHAYCRAQGKRLPTTSEWEYAALASPTAKDGSHQTAYQRQFTDWYHAGSQRILNNIGKSRANIWGIHDLHGLIWEWTEDFNAAQLIADPYGGNQNDSFCGMPENVSTKTGNYGAFMRHMMRTRLLASFSMPYLGFRCASS